MLDIKALFWLSLLGLAIYYWFNALKIKEIAFAAALRHCSEMQVQMLDQNVHLRRLWFKRDNRGQPRFWRAFYFEFTVTGEDRYVGRILMLGAHLATVQLEPHRFH
jgi:Protein of unknown function (DUF3301).